MIHERDIRMGLAKVEGHNKESGDQDLEMEIGIVQISWWADSAI